MTNSVACYVRAASLAFGAALIALPAQATTAIVVPEPESLALLGASVAIGVIALRFLRRR